MPAITIRRRVAVGGRPERETPRYWKSLSRSKVRAWPCRRCGLPASYAARVEMGVALLYPIGDSPNDVCRRNSCSYGPPARERRPSP